MMSRFQECSGVFIQGISVEPASFAEKDKKSDPQTKHAAYYEPESPFAFHEWHAREIHTVKSGDEGQRHKDSGDNGQYPQPLFRLFPGMGIRQLHEFIDALLNALQTAEKMVVSVNLFSYAGAHGAEGPVPGQKTCKKGETEQLFFDLSRKMSYPAAKSGKFAGIQFVQIGFSRRCQMFDTVAGDQQIIDFHFQYGFLEVKEKLCGACDDGMFIFLETFSRFFKNKCLSLDSADQKAGKHNYGKVLYRIGADAFAGNAQRHAQDNASG